MAVYDWLASGGIAAWLQAIAGGAAAWAAYYAATTAIQIAALQKATATQQADEDRLRRADALRLLLRPILADIVRTCDRAINQMNRVASGSQQLASQSQEGLASAVAPMKVEFADREFSIVLERAYLLDEGDIRMLAFIFALLGQHNREIAGALGASARGGHAEMRVLEGNLVQVKEKATLLRQRFSNGLGVSE